MNRPRYLTLEEAAEIARAPVKSVRGWIAAGRLQSFRPGRRVLVREADLVAFIEGAPPAGARAVPELELVLGGRR